MSSSAIGFLSNKISFSIPNCCYSKENKPQFIKDLFKAVKIISQTVVGKKILENISESGRSVLITTHPDGWNCNKYYPPLSKPQFSGKYDPKTHYDSHIYIDLSIQQNLPEYFTEHHYFECVSKGLQGLSCLQPRSPCLRRASFIQIVFHELVHARNSALGMAQDLDDNVATIYGNREEAIAISNTNTLLKELNPHEDTRLLLQYGHQLPSHPYQQQLLRAELPKKLETH